MATWIMVSETSIRSSKERTRRRHRVIHAKARSTTPAAHDDKSQIVSPGVRILRVFGVFESVQQTTMQLSRVFYLLQAGGQILCCQDLRPVASDKLAGVASCMLLHANRSRAVFSRGAAKSMNARTLGATSRA